MSDRQDTLDSQDSQDSKDTPDVVMAAHIYVTKMLNPFMPLKGFHRPLKPNPNRK